jgi:hypothetical protein
MRFEIGHAILSLIVLTAVMSGGGLGLASDTVVDGGARFPQLIASNLEKRTFTLPDDFEGSRNLLLVALQDFGYTQPDFHTCLMTEEAPEVQEISDVPGLPITADNTSVEKHPISVSCFVTGVMYYFLNAGSSLAASA